MIDQDCQDSKGTQTINLRAIGAAQGILKI
jgi:hypothetical protein